MDRSGRLRSVTLKDGLAVRLFRPVKIPRCGRAPPFHIESGPRLCQPQQVATERRATGGCVVQGTRGIGWVWGPRFIAIPAASQRLGPLTRKLLMNRRPEDGWDERRKGGWCVHMCKEGTDFVPIKSEPAVRWRGTERRRNVRWV